MAYENLKKDGIKYVLQKLKEHFVQIKDSVRSVNGEGPDENGDITLSTVQFAQNLQSESVQTNSGTFIQRMAGGDTSVDSGDAWLMKVLGQMTHTGYTPESIEMTVTPINQSTPISATIDRDTFVGYVATSGTITLTFTTAWSANPALYGITVSGTPAAGDQIVVVYVKEVRGTITQSDPQAFHATGWNLYNSQEGYAKVVKYSDTYGYHISGSYTALKYSATLSGTQSSITVTSDAFTVPGDGYVWVTGGSAADTAIWATWSDWTETANGGEFEAYVEYSVDLSGVMNDYFPNGLLSSGTVCDEIDLNIGQAISRVERLAYNATNLANAASSGREYAYDEDYIYLARAAAISQNISVIGAFTANDHGLEFFDETEIPVGAQIMYGNNLKNKLERDVLTISAQTLTTAQKSQARANIGAASVADIDSVNYMRYMSASAASSHDITIPDASAHLLIINSNATSCAAVLQVASTSGSAVTVYQISKGAGLSYTTASGKVVITLDSSRPLYVLDLKLRGSWCSVS